MGLTGRACVGMEVRCEGTAAGLVDPQGETQPVTPPATSGATLESTVLNPAGPMPRLTPPTSSPRASTPHHPPPAGHSTGAARWSCCCWWARRSRRLSAWRAASSGWWSGLRRTCWAGTSPARRT